MLNRAVMQAIMLGIFLLGVSSGIAAAEADDCPALVFFGDGGKDVGQCLDFDEGLCATKAYAEQQGLQRCATEVYVFDGRNKVDTIRTPTVERDLVAWLTLIGYWLLPVVVGGLSGAAILFFFWRQRGQHRRSGGAV